MSETTPTLDLYVRSLAPARGSERLHEIVDQLDRMETDGQIDGYDIHVWGDAVATDAALSETETGSAVLSQVAAFQQWALTENVSVGRFFERREQSSALTGETTSVITLPEVTVAEYQGRELVGMAPHRDGEETVSVREYLDDVAGRHARDLSEEAAAASRLAVPNGD